MCLLYTFFLSSHKYCDCCGNGNSQNVAAVGDLCVADNTCACFSFFCCHLNFFQNYFFQKILSGTLPESQII